MPALPAPPQQRRRRAARQWLAVATVVLLASWLRPLPQDEGWLLEVAGRPVDVAGQLQGHWQALQRRCEAVQRWPAGSPRWREAQQVLAGYSPPASTAARPVQLLGAVAGGADGSGRVGDGAGPDGEWLLAEVRWDGEATGTPLDPAIVPLRREAGVLQVQAEGVWSGDTGPWWAPVVIRRYLAQRLPGLPANLPLCLDPTLPPFNR